MNGSELLSIALIALGILLLLHHLCKHRSKAHEESCPEACYFQIPDVSNHETWIVVCFTNALSLLVLGPRLGGLSI